MFKPEDILDLLNEGQDADTIANNFTGALNEAIHIQKEAKKLEAETIRSKIAAAQGLLDCLFDFIEQYYPDMVTTGMSDAIDGVKLVDMMDQAEKEVKALIELSETFNLKKVADPVKECVNPDRKTFKVKNDGKIDPLSEFLQQYNL